MTHKLILWEQGSSRQTPVVPVRQEQGLCRKSKPLQEPALSENPAFAVRRAALTFYQLAHGVTDFLPLGRQFLDASAGNMQFQSELHDTT